jgi:hypothetical protein
MAALLIAEEQDKKQVLPSKQGIQVQQGTEALGSEKNKPRRAGYSLYGAQ